MGRKNVSIPIEGIRLKELLLQRAEKIEQAAETLGCTRQTLHAWFTTNRMPPAQLAAVVRHFSISREEVRSLRPKKDLCVLYRTLRDVSVPETIHEKVKTLAQEVLSLQESEALTNSGKTIVPHKSTSPAEVANYIRRVLELPHQAIMLDQLISALEHISIPVVFFPFDKALVDANICAFTASIVESRIIFVDANCSYEDVSWRIFHELGHIVLRHDSSVTKEDERFCDAVANEITTPAKFFEEHRDILKRRLNTEELWRLPAIARELAALLGASFRGIVIALETHKLIAKGSSKDRYLWGAFMREKNNLKRVHQFISPKGGDELNFWKEALEDASKIKLLRWHLLARDGLLSGSVSIERAAEIFKIDTGTMTDLRRHWTTEYAVSAAG